MPADFEAILRALSANRVEFIVIGGLAMVSHGSAFVTADLDICYERSPKNLEALAKALAPFRPRLRGAPENLPFRLDSPTLKGGLNFTLITDAGDLDLLGELKGVGIYKDLLPGAVECEIYAMPILVMGLEDLIRSKETAGRRKDRLHLEELRELKRRRDKGGTG